MTAAPAGLALAGALWLAFGAHSPTLTRLDEFQARLTAARSSAANPDAVTDLVRAASVPVFALASGPGEGGSGGGQVRLDGVAMTPTLKAALISIGGKPADWLDEGASRDGVTLVAVQASAITIDTAAGRKDIAVAQGGGEPGPGPATFFSRSDFSRPGQLQAPPSGFNYAATPRGPGGQPFSPPGMPAPQPGSP